MKTKTATFSFSFQTQAYIYIPDPLLFGLSHLFLGTPPFIHIHYLSFTKTFRDPGGLAVILITPSTSLIPSFLSIASSLPFRKTLRTLTTLRPIPSSQIRWRNLTLFLYLNASQGTHSGSRYTRRPQYCVDISR
ncbi:hypothetical protein BJ165DRAFT_403837 [Panaeolus papilionaceus]|nr:hypothetical protein BJ165DRAFT_403837 [Panaeolus papilionaceus]